MGVTEAHLVQVTLGDASDHVLHVRADGADARKLVKVLFADRKADRYTADTTGTGLSVARSRGAFCEMLSCDKTTNRTGNRATRDSTAK